MPYKYDSSWAYRQLGQERGRRRAAKEKGDVIAQIQSEAKKAGATLAHDGKGGLDPNLALQVFQRDKWKCSIPNCKTPQKDLDLDHISGHEKELAEDPEADKWLKEQAKEPKDNSLEGLHVLCLRHHDMVHKRENAIEDGKKPPEMTK